MTTRRDIGLLRLAAQRLAGPGPVTATDTVHWMTAMQAQDPSGVLTSVALRTAAGTRQGVEAAFNAGEIVKSWPLRGTLHLVTAQDLPWMLRLLAPRTVAGAASRRRQLGLDEAGLARARQLTEGALAGGQQLRRDDLLTVWRDGGLITAGQRGYHMLWHMAQHGVVCFGPVRDGEQLVVLVDEWIPHPSELEREEALGALATRYFLSHGPATTKDFTRWAGLVAADVRAGLALARPRLASIEVDGVEYFLDPQAPDLLTAWRRDARGVFLLPGFDEFILGYQDRRAVLATEFANHIVPGGNGMFRPTVVSDGQVVGVWQRTGRGAKRTISATPFTSFPERVAQAIPRVYDALP